MDQQYLNCRKCKAKTKHAIFEDDWNLPDNKRLVQCYECEVKGIAEVDKEQLNG